MSMKLELLQDVQLSDSVITAGQGGLGGQLSAELSGCFMTRSEFEQRMRTVPAVEFDPETAEDGVFYFVTDEEP